MALIVSLTLFTSSGGKGDLPNRRTPWVGATMMVWVLLPPWGGASLPAAAGATKAEAEAEGAAVVSADTADEAAEPEGADEAGDAGAN